MRENYKFVMHLGLVLTLVGFLGMLSYKNQVLQNEHEELITEALNLVTQNNEMKAKVDEYVPQEFIKYKKNAKGLPEVVDTFHASRNSVKTMSFGPYQVEENQKYHIHLFSCNPTAPTPTEPPTTDGPQVEDWGYIKIKAKDANEIAKAFRKVKVCVVDTGLAQHEDVKAILAETFVGGTTNDLFGHGTHVAGIITAANNSVGVVGSANAIVELLVAKGLDDEGSGSMTDLMNAINWCGQNGAEVINNSWGGGSYSQFAFDTISYWTRRGVKFTFSAGNDSGPTNYPAAYQIPGLYSVSATDQNDFIASFSSRGKVELAAPGVRILSTVPAQSKMSGSTNGYAYASGTSMAAPEAAAALALSLSAGLPVGVDNIGDPALYGTGRVNALKSTQGVQ